MVRLQGSLAVLGPDNIVELPKVRARAIVAPVGQRFDECEKFCERASKRVEKAQEAVAEALKSSERGVGGGSVVWKHSEPKLQPTQFRSQ